MPADFPSCDGKPLRRLILDVMFSPADGRALAGRIAVVAGATRGAGRGIAAALGEAGATVICTGRSSRSHALPSASRGYREFPDSYEHTQEVFLPVHGHVRLLPAEVAIVNHPAFQRL